MPMDFEISVIFTGTLLLAPRQTASAHARDVIPIFLPHYLCGRVPKHGGHLENSPDSRL